MKAIKNIKGWRCILLLMALTFLMPADVEGAGKKDNSKKRSRFGGVCGKES